MLIGSLGSSQYYFLTTFLDGRGSAAISLLGLLGRLSTWRLGHLCRNLLFAKDAAKKTAPRVTEHVARRKLLFWIFEQELIPCFVGIPGMPYISALTAKVSLLVSVHETVSFL
ncbi:MAG: hypothetical protein CMM32_01660 [Rhodospirillaceae bacterium]|nr:hypothetical protein [Rhodospirillaceae bacterium]